MTARTKKRIVWTVLTALPSVLLLGFVGPPFIPYKRVDNWVCPVSGSMKTEITWFGCLSHQEQTVSALEQWLKRREPLFEPQWQFCNSRDYYVLASACSTGLSPEIYQLSPFLDHVVGELSDERLAGLVAVLRHGSRVEQEQMIRSISREAFDNE